MIKLKYRVMPAVICSALLIHGCGLLGSKEQPMLQVGEHEYSAGICRVFASSAASQIQDEYGSGCWSSMVSGSSMEEYMRAQVQDDVMNILTFAAMAEDEGMTLSDGESKLAEQVSDKLLARDIRKIVNADKDEVSAAAQAYMLSVKYQESIRGVALADAAAEDHNVITGRQLVLPYVSDTDRSAAVDVMTSVKAGLKGGMTLNQLIPLYSKSQDDIMVEYTREEVQNDGRIAFFSLRDGQVSDVVDLGDRLILFQCIDSDPEELEAQVQQEQKQEAELALLETTLDKYTSAHEVIWNYDQWEDVDISDLAVDADDSITRIYIAITQ